MRTSYAVKWREPNGRTYIGKLEIGPAALTLEGRDGADEVIRRTIELQDVRNVRTAQRADERLDRQTTLVIEHPGGDYLVTSTVTHTGVLHEIVQRLSELMLHGPRRATVVVPLKEGMLDRARELAGRGPPFEPADTFLARHQLLLTPNEAIFVFEADSPAGLEGLLGEIDLLTAAEAWSEIAAGAPRLAEVAYVWERPLQLVAGGLGF